MRSGQGPLFKWLHFHVYRQAAIQKPGTSGVALCVERRSCQINRLLINPNPPTQASHVLLSLNLLLVLLLTKRASPNTPMKRAMTSVYEKLGTSFHEVLLLIYPLNCANIWLALLYIHAASTTKLPMVSLPLVECALTRSLTIFPNLTAFAVCLASVPHLSFVSRSRLLPSMLGACA